MLTIVYKTDQKTRWWPEGDACDSDDDNDGCLDSEDDYPLIFSEDSDLDGNANDCDICDLIQMMILNKMVFGDIDNCPYTANPFQIDTDCDLGGCVWQWWW